MSIKAFLEFVKAAEGAPYIWGGKCLMLAHPVHGLVPSPFPMPVYDCSGLVTVALYKSGWKDWRATHNAQALMQALPRVDEPEAGDLIFYGSPDHATHVEVVTGAGMFGALGGDHNTTEPTPGKCVQLRSHSRPDRIRYARNPLRAIP